MISEEEDEHLLYLRYVQPREITELAIEDESQIEKAIYDSSCLPVGTPYVVDDRVALAHVDKGFTPLISGRGPPAVYDRWGNQMDEADKRFQVWPETGEVQCTTAAKSDDIDASIGRGQDVVLMDISTYLANKAPSPRPSLDDSGGGGEQFVPLVGIGAAIAGIIAFFTLRQRWRR